MLPYHKTLKPYSQKLRKSMTDAEVRLWFKLKGKQLKGLQFYRQKVIGNYIVDFYCPKAKLVIELDGGQHYSEEGKTQDTVRDAYMAQQGLRVCRFPDDEVLKNMNGVLEEIWKYL